MDLVYHEKGIDTDSMSDEEYDDFLKKTMSKEDYEDLVHGAKEFKKQFEEYARKKGIEVVSKEEFEKDREKYEGMYGFSLKDAIEGKEPEKVEKK